MLARVEHPDCCMRVIEERTGEMDADREDGDRIRETFTQLLAKFSPAIPVKARYLLTAAATTQLVELALNGKYTAAQASRRSRRSGSANCGSRTGRGKGCGCGTGLG